MGKKLFSDNRNASLDLKTGESVLKEVKIDLNKVKNKCESEIGRNMCIVSGKL